MQNEELIKALREDAEWAHANEWETPITLGDHLGAAADALEACDAEIERLSQIVLMKDGEIGDRDREIERLKEAERWIPVSERLPTSSGRFMVLIKCGRNKTHVEVENFCYTNDGHRWGDSKCYSLPVIAWRPRPLPEAPKGE